MDIIALRCYACRKYYACYHCHDRLEDYAYQAYPQVLSEDKVVICGACRNEMTIVNYKSHNACSQCGATFNPACAKHDDIYFQ